MVIGPLFWAGAMLVPAIGQHGSRTIYPRLTDMMGRGGFTPLHVLILAVALTLAGAGFPFIVWIRRRALLVTPAGLVALACVLLPVAIFVGARTYSAAQDANSSWQEIGQTAPPITAGIWFCVLGMLTVCLSGLLALGRRDSRTLLAFLAVSQVGWGLLALGAGDPTSMLGLVTLLATGLLGLGAMAAALFAGGTLTSDIEPDGAGPRPFGVPIQPLALGAWTAGALTLIGAPLFGGFVARQMISASIIHSRGLAVPLVGVSWAGDALLGLAILRATAPSFTTFLDSGGLYTASSDEDENEEAVRPRFWNLTTLLPLVPAAILGLLAILVGAVPQVLLQLGGLPAASALVQAGAADQALTTSTIGYQLEAGQWLPSIAWLAIIVLALVVLFALPASLRESKPVYLAGMADRSGAAPTGESAATDEEQPEEISAELAYLPDPVDTWSDLDAAFTSPWLLPLNELLLHGIDEDYPREVEPSDEDEDEGEDEPEEPASRSNAAASTSELPESKTGESARKPDRSGQGKAPSTSQNNQQSTSGKALPSGSSARNSKTSGLKKSGKGSGR
jgi:formate hydrogenlyase subunit 3/multisubunit Na+/H+ antiporter MnhD subunit